jgi:hypothetical protein
MKRQHDGATHFCQAKVRFSQPVTLPLSSIIVAAWVIVTRYVNGGDLQSQLDLCWEDFCDRVDIVFKKCIYMGFNSHGSHPFQA